MPLKLPLLMPEDDVKACAVLERLAARPDLDSWKALADLKYELLLPEVPSEDPFGRDVLHALVEVSWEAWKGDRDSCRRGLFLGLMGDVDEGMPPWLNHGIADAHARLGTVIGEEKGMSHSEDSLALGRLLQTFHLIEGFVRPNLVLAAFLMKIAAGDSPTVKCVLLHNGRMASFRKTLERYDEALGEFKAATGAPPTIEVLRAFAESFKEGSERDVDAQGSIRVGLGTIRNAIAHHDFDIREGTVRIRWRLRKGGTGGPYLLLPPDDLQKNLLRLRGLGAMLVAWEETMMIAFGPRGGDIEQANDEMRRVWKLWFEHCDWSDHQARLRVLGNQSPLTTADGAAPPPNPSEPL